MMNSKTWRHSAIAWILFVSPSLLRAQAGYQVITVDNPGTIDGIVMWSGPVPLISKLMVTKDHGICDPDSKKSTTGSGKIRVSTM